MSEEVFISPESGGIEWRAGSLYLGLHLRLAARTKNVVVVHSRGWSAGSRPNRVYVPAQYHVFLILSRDASGVHKLDHLISLKVRLDPEGGSDAMAIPWRRLPNPTSATTNGARPGENGQ